MMGIFKRAITSMLRNFGKTLIFLVLVLILGALIAGAISVQAAVANTETGLRQRMRPVVNLEYDVFAFMEQSEDWEIPPQRISTDTIRTIGNLPYVKHHNYSVGVWLHSFDFNRYVPEMVGHEPVDWRLGTVLEGWPNEVYLTGVSRPEIVYIEQGSVELVDGRTFTEAEMTATTDLETIPVVISRPLAEANDLSLNGTFTLSSITVRTDANGGTRPWSESELLEQRFHDFEIIGLFDLPDRRIDLVSTDENDQEEFNKQDTELNPLYVPSWVAEEMNRQAARSTYEMMTEGGFVIPNWENFDPDHDLDRDNYADALFVLEDPLDIEAFRAEVEPLIPSYYHVRDLSGNFEEISTSMKTMLWISEVVLIVAIVAAFLIFSLIIVLFFRDRRYEMGIYLALGETKIKLVSQVILEVIATALIGITLALFVGNIASMGISQTLLYQELTREQEPEASTGPYGLWTYFERLNWDVELSADEMMDAFDVSLDREAILIFYGVGTVTIIASTLVPVMYITRLNPKKILMEAESS